MFNKHQSRMKRLTDVSVIINEYYLIKSIHRDKEGFVRIQVRYFRIGDLDTFL